jgi:hypothetical protein
MSDKFLLFEVSNTIKFIFFSFVPYEENKKIKIKTVSTISCQFNNYNYNYNTDKLSIAFFCYLLQKAKGKEDNQTKSKLKVSQGKKITSSETNDKATIAISPGRVRSPERKARKNYSSLDINGCDHSVKANYEKMETASFFTQSYYQKNANAPSKCKTCARKFGDEYKVGSRSPVYACCNAYNKNNLCVHAFCKDCFNVWLMSSEGSDSNTNKRVRRGTIKTLEY